MSRIRKNLLLLLVIFAAGCATPTAFVKQPFSYPPRVAVLPVNNHSTDFLGPVVVRNVTQRWLAERGYVTLPQDIVDEELQKMGFTDGGQLAAAKIQDIQAHTGADALLYVELLDFNFLNIGFYQKKKVELHLKLVDARTGERLWEDTQREARTELALTPQDAAKAFARGLATKALQNVLKMPLFDESTFLVARMLRTLPRYDPGDALVITDAGR